MPCANKSHRAVLAAIADGLHLEYPSRASIDDLISLILRAQSCTLALDDIDRIATRLCYSLLSLSTRHNIIATATECRRVKPLLDRQAAIIVPLPPVPIAAIVADRYPDLSPTQVHRIAALAHTPAAALYVSESVHAGQPLPASPATSIYPVLLIVSLAALAFIRYYSAFDFSPAVLALISGVAFYVRRLLWRSN
ncbi:MAG: hypothetical protein H5U01_00920 [Clostridia bacterium]|nr:hypothetical protein [Clostridia bacterium]